MSGASASAGIIAGVAAPVFVLDRFTKWLVVERMDLRGVGRIEVWDGVFALRMAWNQGVNFGLLASDHGAMRWGLVAVAVLVSAAVAIWACRRGGVWMAAGAGALIGGALGNALDRLTYGAVADFLNLSCCGLVNPYAFNIADVAIFAGAFILAFAPASAQERGDRV